MATRRPSHQRPEADPGMTIRAAYNGKSLVGLLYECDAYPRRGDDGKNSRVPPRLRSSQRSVGMNATVLLTASIQHIDQLDLNPQAGPVGEMLVLVGEQMQVHAGAADKCGLGGVGITVGQFKAKGVSTEGDAFFDIASRDQRHVWTRAGYRHAQRLAPAVCAGCIRSTAAMLPAALPHRRRSDRTSRPPQSWRWQCPIRQPRR